jgi:RNA polymerase sigma factor (sigma-70 family)
MYRNAEERRTVGLDRVVRRLPGLAGQLESGLPTDRALLERFAASRDEAAFAEVVRRHGPMVLGVARRVLQDWHDAEDVFQAAFLVLARKAGSIRWRESVGGWLVPVTHHLALKYRARRERQRRCEAAAPVPVAAPDDPGDPEVGAVLDLEVSRLPEHYRVVLVLCCLEGKTQGQAARQLGLTPGEVRGRLDRGRQRLRRRLQQRGLALSIGVAGALFTAPPAPAALPPALLQNTTRAAALFAGHPVPVGAVVAPRAFDLAQGVLNTMNAAKWKRLVFLLLALLLGTAVLWPAAVSALRADPAQPSPLRVASKSALPQTRRPAAPQPGRPGPARRSLIVLWMSGGPSQFETFDLKPGQPNGGPFKEISTTVPGVRISEHLPRLARLAGHFSIIRSLTHPEGDHQRATYLMQTGRQYGGGIDYPALGSLVARELAQPKATLPPYFLLRTPFLLPDLGPGFLGGSYAPLTAELPAGKSEWRVPPAAAFEVYDKDRAEAMHRAAEKVFDLSKEKASLRDAYGRNPFGESCLIARRLVERGVPVVKVSMSGWDTHAKAFPAIQKLSAQLDPAWSTLLTDLHKRKLLDRTVVVWMGEFGRTPRINLNRGRDHYSRSFSVVLAGGGIKGGQVIGKTSVDGMKIEQRPVTPEELMATILQALHIDPNRQTRTDQGQRVPFVPKGTKAVAEVLR